MIKEPCIVCGIEVEGINRSGKRHCRECGKRKRREYAHIKYIDSIKTGKVHEYRRKAAKFMSTKYRENPHYRLLTRARSRAAVDGFKFDLTVDDIIIPEYCPVLRTPFDYGTYYTMSLDRIDSTKGYIKGNVQVMSHKANAMKNSATNEELIKFAEWVMANVEREPKVNEA